MLDGRKSLMTVWNPIRDLGVWGARLFICVNADQLVSRGVSLL